MNRKIRSSIAAAGLAGTLLFGGAGIALAQSSTSSTAPTTSTAPVTTAWPDRSAHLTSTLAPLVTAGTITQAQADAVVKAMVAAQPADGFGGRGGVGHNSALVASTLGITEAQLQTARQSGLTIAQIATSKGVTVQTVVNALVAAEKTEHPDQTEADIVARVTNRVNGVRPAAAPASTTAAA